MTVTSVNAVAAATAAVKSTFAGKVTEAGWLPGGGAHRPGSAAAYMGFYAKMYINPSFKVTSSAKVDNKAKTITFTLKNDKGRPNHAADILREQHLGRPNLMKMNEKYTVIIQDSAGHVLKRTSVRPMPAA